MRIRTCLSSLAVSAVLVGCAQSAPAGPGWVDLLADDAPNWRTWNADTLAPQWILEDGVLTLTSAGGGNVTNGVNYSDFELAFDWRVAPGGNSGVFYFVSPDREDIPPYQSGPEYQVLDNARHADGRSHLTSAGAVYGLFPTDPEAVRPAGEWNSGRIISRNGKIEHWLNGSRVAAYDMMAEEFRDRVDRTKFVEWRDRFAHTPRGLIVLQDHGDVVSYRNLRIREF